MRLRAIACRALLVAAGVLGAAAPAWSVPLGYRYIGSRVVSEGRVVYWYWNSDHVEIGPFGVSIVARMYARAVDINQERPFVAVVRCDTRKYRGIDSQGPFEAIEDGDPIAAVWSAACDKGVALSAAQRNARLSGAAAAPVETAGTVPSAGAASASSSPMVLAQAAPPSSEPADPRRVDACVRFSETRGAPAGDAVIANTCGYPIEVTLCYKGATGGPFDCPNPARGRYGDSLGPGISHVLPEYRRGRHKGVNVVACRGTTGSVFPRLDEGGGKSGCY